MRNTSADGGNADDTWFVEKALRALMGAIRFVFKALFVIGIIGIIGALILHFAFVRPAAERATVENFEDLKFVGGLLAFSCVIQDYLAISDDIDETMELAEQLKGRAKKCKSSISSFARCAAELAGDAFDAEKRKRAVQHAKKAKRAYEGARRVLSKARVIARDLPAYDDKTSAIKTALNKLIARFQRMGPVDILQLDEGALDAQVEKVLDPYDEKMVEWAEQAEPRYADLGKVAGVVWVANAISPILGNLLMAYLDQYGFDKIMRRAPAFERARQKGCLQGDTLLDAAINFGMEIEKYPDGLDISPDESEVVYE